MAKLEKVKRDQYIYKGFAILENMMKKTLEMAYNTINAIEGEETLVSIFIIMLSWDKG